MENVHRTIPTFDPCCVPLNDLEYPQVRRVSPEIQRVTQGDSVKLDCSAQGNPIPKITWTREGGHLPSGANSEEVSFVCIQQFFMLEI